MNDDSSKTLESFFEPTLQEIADKKTITHNDLLGKKFIEITAAKALELINSLLKDVSQHKTLSGNQFVKSKYDFTSITSEGTTKDFAISAVFKNRLTIENNNSKTITKRTAIKELTGAYFDQSQEMYIGNL